MKSSPLLLPVLLGALFASASCTDNNSTFLPQNASYTADGEAPLSCVPNLDGMITAAELPVAIGASETFLVSPAGTTESVDLDGTVNSMGQRVWNWSTSLASDQSFVLTPQTLGSQWYASSFPSGQFVLPYDAANTIEAVYIKNDQAIYLLGIASTQENPSDGKTLVVYQAPVILYQFPIQVGASWMTSGTSTHATVKGLPYAGTDTYATTVDASGMLLLPDFTFTQVLRVRTLVTISPVAGETTTQLQVSFLFECFGEVARATSQLNEPNADFTTAAEIRRLSATPPDYD
jgi:hypothetical protein